MAHPSFIPRPPPSSCFLLLLLLTLALFTLHHHSQPTTPKPTSKTSLHYYKTTFLSLSSNSTLSYFLRRLTLRPHLAGTPLSLQTSNFVLSFFSSLGLPSHLTSFPSLLSFPNLSSLLALFQNGTVLPLPLAEIGLKNDVAPPYHAYSPSGHVTGPAVFVNFGRDKDYYDLETAGVSVSGAVVLARRGEMSRYAVVEKAAEKGAAAAVMYTEAAEFGGVERGTVMGGLGDPVTPGWGAAEGGERLGAEDGEVLKRFPRIPSMPVSAETAEVILRSMEGTTRVPHEWRRRGDLKEEVGWVGPGPTLLNFTYQGEKKMASIHNVFAVIRGSEEPDRFVLLGNHRDAWTYGAVDPNSGTAALLDIARRYAVLMRLGWKPRRTIILCSWDAEEFGMIGSTEWVEQNLVNLGSKAVAYLNVDCAVQGPGFYATATPQLDNLLLEVMKKVKDPESVSMTLYDKWRTTDTGADILRFSGADSDFAPFLYHAGVPSTELYYGRDFPVYHTAFDSYDWMLNHGDPLFQRHVAIAEVWGLLALHLADDPVLPLNYLSYAAQLQEYRNVLSNLLEGSTVSLHPITASIQELVVAAKEAEEEAKAGKFLAKKYAHGTRTCIPRNLSMQMKQFCQELVSNLDKFIIMKLREQEASGSTLELKKRMLNDRLMFAERGFLDAEGLHGREWFKHLVYGPPGDHDGKLIFFPGIADAVSRSRKMNRTEGDAAIQHEIWRVARAIQRAAYALKGGLT